jgi:TolB-like protein
MSSVIPGYEYDIFISYRQKDNKGDRWVSEFVEALKTELESTFKEEVSVYFDINPHDGLLETHDVDASLKDKLKCLVFIPIISRTYCDPKSFAWEHEFKAFVDQTSHDQFGLKVKLPNGNVENRVLPVKIYDLDVNDIKLCESVLGGVLRGVDFIYKSSGVNRPLRSKEERPQDNLNNIQYRDQINKVANSIKEITNGLKGEPLDFYGEHIEVITTIKKPTVKEKSIIVLPFENISSEPDQEYFSDGLTEEIIADLSHIHDLLVISRSSAMTFKGTKKTIPEIAHTVNVRYVLEGSVRKAGNSLRITAQLIDADTDTHLWTEKYTGVLDNIFEIQEKVSRSIATALKLKLSFEEERNISQRLIIDIQAYEYYLKAKREINNWSEKGMEKALDYLKKGLEISGDNVLFYFGIGFVYFNYINTGLKDKAECILQTEHYVKKIFEMDPDSVYGHRLLGMLNIRRALVQQGVRQLKKTLATDPNDLDTLNWLVIAYCNNGKPHAALPLAQRILEIDPSSSFGPLWKGWVDLLNGNFSESVKNMSEAYKLAPNAPNVKIAYAMILAQNNRMEECYSICEENYKTYPESIFAMMGKCLKYALQGNREKTIKAMSGGVKDKARTDLWDASFIAACDALIDERDEAITSLEYSVNLGAFNYPYYAEIDPLLKNIREEPRFKKLMERVKYEWENFEV